MCMSFGTPSDLDPILLIAQDFGSEVHDFMGLMAFMGNFLWGGVTHHFTSSHFKLSAFLRP